MHAGHETRLTFSLAYSPPEALQALQEGAVTVTADAAADMWAIGVIAYELITRSPAFPRSWSRPQLLQAALGGLAYPWEERVRSFRNLPELRALCGVVRACLSRDSAQRPTAPQLQTALSGLFDGRAAAADGIARGAELPV
jgi:serine/threonine protein kinase